VTVLGLDVANSTGYALVAGDPGGTERLLRCGVMDARHGGDVARGVGALARLQPDLVAVETPYVGRSAGAALDLATLVGRWLQGWEMRTYPTVTVTASIWQLEILSGLLNQRSKRATRKQAARQWARATFGVELGEDEADAAGIATWALRRALLAQRAA
jgi:hypothetical protein